VVEAGRQTWWSRQRCSLQLKKRNNWRACVW